MIVAHLDLDAFFAAVEELEEPRYRTVPLIVGGDPRGRGVVATANYVARRFGIHSAMSCAEALRRCPHATFVRPRHSLYRDYSREVWSTVREIVPTVEQAGIDEGYLDLEEVAPSFDDARAVAEAVRAVVRARTRLSCSLGVATSKVVAKIASDRHKPGGLTVVRPGREAAFLAGFPIRLLPGVGPRAEEKLVAAGIDTIGKLASLGDDDLGVLLRGAVGRQLRDRARGIDPRRLEVSTERISISIEETFAHDIGDPERLHDELRRQALRLAEHLRARGQVGRTVTTKLRYPDFAIRTRSTSLPVGTDDGERIGELACGLLDRALRDRPGPLRLVGVGVSGLADHLQLSLTGDVESVTQFSPGFHRFEAPSTATISYSESDHDSGEAAP
jgi:DNA polymerase-4